MLGTAALFWLLLRTHLENCSGVISEGSENTPGDAETCWKQRQECDSPLPGQCPAPSSWCSQDMDSKGLLLKIIYMAGAQSKSRFTFLFIRSLFAVIQTN